MGSALSKMEEIEFLKVLRRWLNVVFTMSLNNFSLHPSSVVSLRVIRMTALFTLGGGLNTCSCTVNRYSTLYQACIRILRMPYVLLPGPAAMRSATSFLDHSGTTGYQVFVIQHFKEYLAGYIIRIVAGQDKRFSVK